MANVYTKIADILVNPGNPCLKLYQVRFDNSYVDQGYVITPSASGSTTGPEFHSITGAAVINQDAYIVFGVSKIGTTFKITASAPHSSQGTGGHQLNPGSSALNNRLALLFVWGD